MTRPSRNIDRLLIETGLAMMEETGVISMNIRDLVQRAEVNLGMFHYHFKNKETFARAVLQELYETVFSKITHAIDPQMPTIDQLRSVLLTLGRFARDHRKIMLGIATDIRHGNPVTIAFARENFPRHIGLVHTLIVRAQAEGEIAPHPITQVMAFIASTVAIPILLTGIMSVLKLDAFAQLLPTLESTLLTDKALEQRINMALKGVS